MKNLKVTLFLVGSLLTMSYLSYRHHTEATNKHNSILKKEPLLRAKIGEVDSLSITHWNRHLEKLQLKKEKNSWHLLSHTKVEADGEMVINTLQALLQYSAKRKVSSQKQHWSDYGLQNPRVSVNLHTTEGSSHELHIGDPAVVGYGVYIRTGDSDAVYHASAHINLITNKTRFDFRDKKLAKFDFTRLNRLRLDRQDAQSLSFVKKDNRFTLATNGHAKLGKIRSFLSEIDALRVIRFTSPNKADARTLEPSDENWAFRLTWQSGDEAEQRAWLALAGSGELLAKLGSEEEIRALSPRAALVLTKKTSDFL